MTDAERECREAFEAWAKDGLAAASPLWRDFSEPFYRQANGNMESPNYCRSFTQGAWLAFKAGGAWNARHPRADAEDRVVVERVARAIMTTDTGHIQGFWYEPYHVIRDVSKAPAEQELHRTIFRGEYSEMLDLERAKVIARAALKALGGEDGE